MPHKRKSYITKLINAIEQFQLDQLMSDRELSAHAKLSYTMISKIKKWKTTPTMGTLRKLKKAWIIVPQLTRKNFETITEEHTTHNPSEENKWGK